MSSRTSLRDKIKGICKNQAHINLNFVNGYCTIIDRMNKTKQTYTLKRAYDELLSR